MFITVDDVKALTDYDVTEAEIFRAQLIVEGYIGRIEVEITDSVDLMLLARATGYQAAYMQDNNAMVFGQTAAVSINNFGSSVAFRQNDPDAPFIAPLAKIACARLSWKNARSINTGRIMDVPRPPADWSTD